MNTSFSAIIVNRLKRIQGSIAAMTGLVGAGTQSSQGGPGNTAAEASGSTEPSSEQMREQHKVTMLANHRIKVRDYAYESTLPPVRAYHPPRPKGPRPLKRKRQEYETASDEEDDYSMVVLPTVLDDLKSREQKHEDRPAKKPKPLERTPTEPDPESQSQPPTGYSDVSQITTADAALSNVPMDWVYVGRTTTSAWTSSTCPGNSRDTARSPTGYVDASSEGPSQESEPWVDTPPVTPSTPSVPLPTSNTVATTSRLDSPSLHRKNVAFTLATYTPPRLPATTSVKHSLSRTASHILTPPRLSRTLSFRQVQRSRSHMSTPRRLSSGSVTSPSPPAPRYHLRDRKVIKSPTRPTARQRVNSRASTTSLSPRRTNKTRSSTSKSATKNAGKINISPSKPALRRSARRAGMSL